jgi:hypothetical protein
MDVVARAVVPASVEETMMPASTDFRTVRILFRACSAFFVRLVACFFVSHNFIILS